MINQEFFKEHENLKHCKVYRKIMLSFHKDLRFGQIVPCLLRDSENEEFVSAG